MAELPSCNRDCMIHKVKSIYYLVFFRKKKKKFGNLCLEEQILLSLMSHEEHRLADRGYVL